MRKFKYLTILLLLLVVYSCKDDIENEWRKESNEKSLPVAVQEARSFFEKYAAEVELSDQILGLSPGNFAPDWSKSVVTTDGASYVCVNVPIESEIVYEGSFASRYDSIKGASDESYRTAIGQKMIVVKDPATGNFGCYIVTIIPDEKNAVKSGDKAIGMYHNGDLNTKFNGTVLFSMLGSKAYSVAAGRYKDGERYAAASWWWNTSGNTKQLEEEITELVGLKRLTARTKTMTKEDLIDLSGAGGSNPDAGTCWDYPGSSSGSGSTGSSGGGGNDGYSGNVHVIYVNLDGSYNAPNIYLSPNNTPQWTDNTNTNSGSAYSGYIADAGGSSSSSTSPVGYSGTTTTTPATSTASSPTPRDYVKTTGDKFFDGTSNTPPGIGQTQTDLASCAPRAMAYANKLFGGRKTHNDFITYLEDYYHIEIEGVGLRQWIMKDPMNIPYHFTTNVDLVNYDYPSIFIYEEKIAKKVVLTSIPLPPEMLPDFLSLCEPGTILLPDGKTIQFPDGSKTIPVHAVLVVGCKANGDVIYMDPVKNKLQEVNPFYLRDDPKNQYKFIITGIRNL